MFPRLQPPAAPPRRPCLGGRSLILRSLRPAASGSANIINVIVSRVAGKVPVEHQLQETGGDGPGGCRPSRAVPETTHAQNSLRHAPTHGRLWHAPCGGTDRANSTLPRSRRTGGRTLPSYNTHSSPKPNGTPARPKLENRKGSEVQTTAPRFPFCLLYPIF